LHYNEKGRRLSLAEISETEAYHLKQIIEKRIEEVQYHHISHIQARILYESYDSQNGFWS
jgi:predicted DNA-binding protein